MVQNAGSFAGKVVRQAEVPAGNGIIRSGFTLHFSLFTFHNSQVVFDGYAHGHGGVLFGGLHLECGVRIRPLS